MIYTCANAFYFANINEIGGVESHFYYMARKYGQYDMMIFYLEANKKQLDRLRQYAPCVKLEKNDRVICEKVFVNYRREILNQCEAKECIFVIHADYKDLINRGCFSRNSLPIDKRITRYVGVSQLACNSWKELTGIKADNLYQPVIVDRNSKPLMFISATRLTREKGWDRMEKLARYLDKENVNYMWHVYTDSQKKVPTKNMVFFEPRLDISNWMQKYDAYIQLSDNEGFCLSVVEALMMGIPVICTDLPVLKEIGLNDQNSIRLNFNMTDIPINRIKNITDLHFTYNPPEDRWDDILSHKESNYNSNAKYLVEATSAYKNRKLVDAELKCCPEPGTRFEVDYNRLIFLLGANRYNDKFVNLINE